MILLCPPVRLTWLVIGRLVCLKIVRGRDCNLARFLVEICDRELGVRDPVPRNEDERRRAYSHVELDWNLQGKYDSYRVQVNRSTRLAQYNNVDAQRGIGLCSYDHFCSIPSDRGQTQTRWLETYHRTIWNAR